MRVTTRLYFAAFPSVVGVLAVAALGYWGQYARAVPEVILLIAVVTALTTMALSWVNVRYVALRVERLAGVGQGARALKAQGPNTRVGNSRSGADELDAIESEVVQLQDALSAANVQLAREVAVNVERRHQEAGVLAAVAESVSRQLDDVRLPLHILLENQFGDLNENQEELLGAARAATEIAAADISAVADLARLELGQFLLRHDRVFPADVVNAILPVLRAEAQARRVQLEADVAPLIPAIYVDAARIQQSLQFIVLQHLRAFPSGGLAKLALHTVERGVELQFGPTYSVTPSVQSMLSERIILASLGEIDQRDDSLNIRFRL